MASKQNNASFVHLHVHSDFSLGDGAANITDLIKEAKDSGMDTMALTDHATLAGSVKFQNVALFNHFKPIHGMEAYISPTGLKNPSAGNYTPCCYHVLLLAMNTAGWSNLLKLRNKVFWSESSPHPLISRAMLAEFSEGLICTTACIKGEVPSALLRGAYTEALRIAGEYRDIFGAERFFIEVQNIRLAEQQRVNPDLVCIANQLGVRLVGTNNVHFLCRQCKQMHEILTCIAAGTLPSDGPVIKHADNIYLKNAAEMRNVLKLFPGAADNTLAIAEMCNFAIDLSNVSRPKFSVPGNMTDNEYLSKLAWDGLANRFAYQDIPEEYRQRMDMELRVIENRGYSSYFLLIADVINYARENAIPIDHDDLGTWSLLYYALHITDVNPFSFDLPGSDFFGEGSKFCSSSDVQLGVYPKDRPKIIAYLRSKYNLTAKLTTYDSLNIRTILTYVSQAMNLTAWQTELIHNLMPGTESKMSLGMRLAALETLNTPQYRKLNAALMYVFRFQYLSFYANVQADHVILADGPIETIVPLNKQNKTDDIITEWDMLAWGKIGCLKIHFRLPGYPKMVGPGLSHSHSGL